MATVTAETGVMSHDHNILGGGRKTLRSELGPHDLDASRVRPLQSTPNDGDYYLSINVGGDTRYVSYRIHSGSIQAASDRQDESGTLLARFRSDCFGTNARQP